MQIYFNEPLFGEYLNVGSMDCVKHRKLRNSPHGVCLTFAGIIWWTLIPRDVASIV